MWASDYLDLRIHNLWIDSASKSLKIVVQLKMMKLYTALLLYMYVFLHSVYEFQWRGLNGLIAMVGRMVSLCTV